MKNAPMNGKLQGMVLIVDDQPDNLNVLLSIFRGSGLDVRALKNPKMVLPMAMQIMPDLILTDIIMPEMSGIEVCQALKKNSETAEIPVIFITALKFMEEKQKAFMCGGVDYITKPFEREEVLLRVATHLRLAQLQHELREVNEHLEERLARELEERRRQEALLIQQSKMALMGEMLAFVGHQWAQPLTNITMTASILQNELQTVPAMESSKASDMVEDCQVILDSTEFMKETIKNFRHFFSPSREEDKFDLREALEEVRGIMQPALDQYRVALEIQGLEKACYRGYENEFKQVVMNLFMNAKDVIEGREVSQGRISVLLEKKGQNWCLTVKDNAGGIPEELLPDRLFAPYVSTKGEKGTGIGLYMSKTLIEYHMNGRLNADNDEEGAVFVLELKGSEEEAQEKIPEAR